MSIETDPAWLAARVKLLTDAILDIDAHATPIGEDDDGFVTGGYLISVGSLHRALGLVGHSAARCPRCGPDEHGCIRAALQMQAAHEYLRESLEAIAAAADVPIEAECGPRPNGVLLDEILEALR